MGVLNSEDFQDLLDLYSKCDSLNMPVYKEKGLNLSYIENGSTETKYKSASPVLPFARSEVFNAKILDWRLMTLKNDDIKPVYEVTFDIMDSNFEFQPGDTIGILAENNEVEVEQIIKQIKGDPNPDFSYELSVDSSVKGAKIPPHVPFQSTLRHVLTYCLDFRSVLKKLFILALSEHTENEDERNILKYLCSKEGTQAYDTYILNKNTCLIDILEAFKSCKPTVEVLFANLPRLLPRPYSVANSKNNKNELRICFSVIKSANGRKGIATGFIEELISNENSMDIEKQMQKLSLQKDCSNSIKMYLRNNLNGFALPKDLSNPMIFIATGTGISPFIGFLEELTFVKHNENAKLGAIWLFYGCRDPNKDFLYKKELNIFVNDGVLTKLQPVFSRIQNEGVKYVQGAIKSNGAEVIHLIQNGGHVYVCGDLKTMAVQVRDTIKQCLVEQNGMQENDAENFIAQMEKDKRYLIDLWS